MSVPLGQADYPRLGPLLATAFDRAVRVTLRSWVWIIALMLACFGLASLGAAQRSLDVCMLVWAFTAAANAMRPLTRNIVWTRAPLANCSSSSSAWA